MLVKLVKKDKTFTIKFHEIKETLPVGISCKKQQLDLFGLANFFHGQSVIVLLSDPFLFFYLRLSSFLYCTLNVGTGILHALILTCASDRMARS